MLNLGQINKIWLFLIIIIYSIHENALFIPLFIQFCPKMKEYSIFSIFRVMADFTNPHFVIESKIVFYENQSG
jgi:hypothetical protein